MKKLNVFNFRFLFLLLHPDSGFTQTGSLTDSADFNAIVQHGQAIHKSRRLM
jgi:hypothetical protein